MLQPCMLLAFFAAQVASAPPAEAPPDAPVGGGAAVAEEEAAPAGATVVPAAPPAAPARPAAPAPSEPPTADSAGASRHAGIQVAVGAASFIGDLRGPDPVFVVDIQGKVMHISTLGDHLRFYLAVDVLMGQTTAEGGKFTGYDDGATLQLLSFLFIPMVCGSPHEMFQVCGGIGQGTVNVNADNDRRDWGTWNYQLQADVSPLPWLQVFALTKYVGAVEQQVDGVDSAFSFVFVGAGAGATF